MMTEFAEFGWATAARLRLRHLALIGTFVTFVLGPTGYLAIHFWLFVPDQYVASAGFVIRSIPQSPAETSAGYQGPNFGGATSDAAILHAFIQDRDMAIRVGASSQQTNRLPVEEQERRWRRAVAVSYDPTSGKIKVQVIGATPDDARQTLAAIIDESVNFVQILSDTAQTESVALARGALDRAAEQLTKARQARAAFQIRSQTSDAGRDAIAVAEILKQLNGDLAESLIAFDLLKAVAPAGDRRLVRTQLDIDALEGQIELLQFGGPGPPETSLPALIGQQEAAEVSLAFAEQSYAEALEHHGVTVAEATRRKRYLAVFVGPTRPEASTYPRRVTTVGTAFGALLLLWVMGALAAYAIRDST